MTYIIVGASSGLGRALAEQFAGAGHELVLVSRDSRDIERLAHHLTIKYGVRSSHVAMDLGANPLPLEQLDTALEGHQPLHGLLLPVGLNDASDEVGNSECLARLQQVNYTAPCLIINHYLPRLERSGGNIIGFGSIATARGRSRNAAYAAAKSALESYFESVEHATADRGVDCQYYILGYLDTNLAFSQDLMFPLASPERVAQVVYKRRHRRGKRFMPWPWYIVYRALQFLPWALFKRLSF